MTFNNSLSLVSFLLKQYTKEIRFKLFEVHQLTVPRYTGKMSEEKDDQNATASSLSETDDKSDSSPKDKRRSSIKNKMESLGKYLSEKLRLSSDEEDGPSVKILKENTLDGIIEYLKEKNCKNIITMAGAGISTSAGIPDFRSPGSGLYDNLEKYNLPHPQAIFELDYFHENPKPFFVLAKELYPGKFEPTISHYFIRLLNEKGLLLRHYTQNIDTLERIAGIPEDKLVEAHGTFYTGHCLECKKEYTLEWMKDKIFKDEIPTCENCPGVVKPDIVFFGENLPPKFHNCLEKDFNKCDLLIIMGSSLVVHPFAGLVDLVPETCPRLLINREKVGSRNKIMSLFGFSSGLDLDGKHTRDVAWLGDCDKGCQEFADKLGWGEELIALRESELEKLKKESAENKLYLV